MQKNDFEEREAEFLVRIGKLTLVYPKNYGFIKDLNNKYIHKLQELGWNLPKTIFIEIPYVMTFTDDYLPALAAAYIIDVVRKNAYFKCLITMRNYIPNTNFIELKDTILHEKEHLDENEPKFLSGKIPDSDPTLKEELRVNSAVSKMIQNEYGDFLVTQSKKRSIEYANKTQSSEKTIVSGYLEYWLWKYLNDNFEKYSKLAYAATPLMMGTLNQLNPNYCEKIKKAYIAMFNFKDI